MIFGTPPIVTNGLVLNLDAGSRQSYVSGSTTWSDLSGNINNVTLTNGPTFNSANQGSIVFDGINDYAITTVNVTPTLNLTTGVTSESWITPTALASAANGGGIISKGLSSDGNAAAYEMLIRSSGSVHTPYFRIKPTSSPANTNASGLIVMPLNQPSHLVGTYDGSTIRVYINGVQSGTGVSQSGSLETNVQQLALGTRYVHRGNSTSAFTGRIHTIRIYNRALSDQEVAQNYNALKSRFGLT